MRCPVLLIHGTADQCVPVEMGRSLASAFAEHAAPCELLEIEKADHLLRNSNHMKKAMKAIVSFVSRVSQG